MKFLFSAGVIVYFKRKDKIQYLLLRYSKGHWDFPKGGIEKDETKEQAALRELKEEAGQLVQLHEKFEHSFEYFFKDNDGDLAKKKVYFFIGKTKSKKVALSHEHTDFAWLELDDALQKLTYDNAKTLLKKADAFLKKLFVSH